MATIAIVCKTNTYMCNIMRCLTAMYSWKIRVICNKLERMNM